MSDRENTHDPTTCATCGVTDVPTYEEDDHGTPICSGCIDAILDYCPHCYGEHTVSEIIECGLALAEEDDQ